MEQAGGIVIALVVVATLSVSGLAVLLFPPSAPAVSGAAGGTRAIDSEWPTVSGSPTPTTSPTPSPTTTATSTPTPAASAGLPRFVRCRPTKAPPGTTHLKPSPSVTLTSTEIGGGVPPVSGSVRVVHVADLVVTDGRLASGAGYEAAMGIADGSVRVAPATVRVPVTLAVLDSPRAGQRVAFVELQVAPAEPVRWARSNGLEIGTDGGDGGYVAPATAVVVDGQDGDALNRILVGYGGAFRPGAGSPGCAVRVDGRTADGIMFETGYGDGGYPTYMGYDAHGRVVSVVSFGFVLPWRFSGLPGPTPKGVEPG